MGKTLTHIAYLAEGSPEAFELAEGAGARGRGVAAVVLPAACRECEHLEERDARMGYPPLCGLVVNAVGQPCASAFDGLLRAGLWPADGRCPGRRTEEQ